MARLPLDYNVCTCEGHEVWTEIMKYTHTLLTYNNENSRRND